MTILMKIIIVFVFISINLNLIYTKKHLKNDDDDSGSNKENVDFDLNYLLYVNSSSSNSKSQHGGSEHHRNNNLKNLNIRDSGDTNYMNSGLLKSIIGDDDEDELEVFVGSPFYDANNNSIMMNSLDFTKQNLIYNSKNNSDDINLFKNIVRYIVIGLFSLILCIMCILGNILVILSVFTYRPLQNVQNMFIVSLAVADLTVCLLCVPFHIVTELANGKWLFGPIICHFFLTLDILLCTASILNLCCIALDRYWAIKDSIKYAQQRTFKRVLIMIAISWLVSACVSVPGIFWNRKNLNNQRPTTIAMTTSVALNQTTLSILSATQTSNEQDYICDISKDKAYRFYSSFGTFYIPLVIMSFVYLRIYLETKKRLGERARAAKKLANSIANSSIGSSMNKKNSKEKKVLRSIFTCCPCVLCKINKEKGGNTNENNSIKNSGSIKNNNSKKNSNTKLNLLNNANANNINTNNTPSTSSANNKNNNENRIDAANNAAKLSICSSTAMADPKDTKITFNLPTNHEIRNYNNDYDNDNDNDDDDYDEDRKDGKNTNGSDELEQFGKQATILKIDDASNKHLLSDANNTGKSTVTVGINTKKSWTHNSANTNNTLQQRQKISLTRERRAARTLGIIMGVFTICWAPFFCVYLLQSFEFPFNDTLITTLTWMGYVNSALNPVIYTIFNLDFRKSFKRILFNCVLCKK